MDLLTTQQLQFDYVLDTETTGLHKSEICELSIIDKNGAIVFNSLIKPINGIPEDVTKIHGITNEMVKDAPTFDDIAPQITNLLEYKNVAIYNAEFDVNMLLSSASVLGTQYEINFHPVCVMEWYAINYNKDSGATKDKYKLLVAAQQQGINTKQEHRSLSDCQLTLQLINEVNRKMSNNILLSTTDLSTVDVTKLVKFTQSIIEFDNSALIATAEATKAKYAGLIITEDMQATIKTERAAINAIINSIEDSRKKIKKQYNTPLTDFESKIKTVNAIYQSVIDEMDKSLNAFEEKRKQEKKLEVEKMLLEIKSGYPLNDKYSVQVIIQDRYLNKNISDKEVAESIHQQCQSLLEQQKNEEAALELERLKRQNRELLIRNLNAKYSVDFLVSKFDNFNDDQINSFYANLEKKEEVKKEELSKVESTKQEIKTPEPQEEKPTGMVFKTLSIGAATEANIDAVIVKLRSLGFMVEVV